MKLRILLSAVLVTALALPVIATTTRFPDVPADHQYVESIRWASERENPLFRGFPDGNFRPDEELTERQFTKVVDRLFDTYDSWTRAQTAALLHYGFIGLQDNPLDTTTTHPVVIETTTTQPVVTEGEQPGQGPGEVDETTTTTTSTTTTTTQPTTTTTTDPPFPIGDRLNTLWSKNYRVNDLFQRAANDPTNKNKANDAKQAADDAVAYAIQLREEYLQNGGTSDDGNIKSLDIYYETAIKHQTNANMIVEWQTIEQPANTPDKQIEGNLESSSGYNLIPYNHRVSRANLRAVVSETYGYSDDIKQDLWRYVFYHYLPIVEELDTLRKVQPTKTNRDAVNSWYHSTKAGAQQAFRELMRFAGFSFHSRRTYGNHYYRAQTTTTNRFPIEERLTVLESKISDTHFRFRKATDYGHRWNHPQYYHAKTRHYGNFVKQTADDAVAYANQLRKEYNNHPEATTTYIKRLQNTYELAVRWQTTAGTLVDWQTTEPPQNTAYEEASAPLSIEQWPDSSVLTDELRASADNIRGLIQSLSSSSLTGEHKRGGYRYAYYHALLIIDKLDTLKQSLTTQTERNKVNNIKSRLRSGSVRSSLSWLMEDAGFKHTYGNNGYQFEWRTSTS